MPARPELVKISGNLKVALVDFGQTRRYAAHYEHALDLYLAGTAGDDVDFANAIDQFLLEYRLPDGRTVVEHFVEEHPDLSADERALMLGWRDAVYGFFHIDRHQGQLAVLTNLIDEMVYPTRSNMGLSAIRQMKTGAFLLTRLVPIDDEWLVSGLARQFPATLRDTVYHAAANFASQHPALVFRNPEKLAQGWELQRAERDYFIDFFGTDVVVMPGSEVPERMRAYMHFRMHDARDNAGKSAADVSQEKYGDVPPELDLNLPDDLTDAETVGVIYDEIDGLNFLRDFALLEAVFANPDLVTGDRHRETLLVFLTEPSVSPVALRRLAEQNPEHASRVFASLLNRPDFSWERDGDGLIREHKPEYFERPPLPSVTPLSSQLARARLAQPETAVATPQPHRQHQPPQRSSRSRKRRSSRSR